MSQNQYLHPLVQMIYDIAVQTLTCFSQRAKRVTLQAAISNRRSMDVLKEAGGGRTTHALPVC